MKSSYEKYIDEVRNLKSRNYEDFKKSGFSSYIDYMKEELKKINIKIKYRKKKEAIPIS